MPVRVLHVMAQMDAGGVEVWLMQLLRSVDPSRVRMDFAVTCAEPGFHDDEIRRRGSRIVPCVLSRSHPARFAWRFLRLLRERGPYDVVHSHLHHFSGLPLLLARLAGVPVRIAHCHSDTSAQDAAAGLRRRLYLRTMEALVRAHATHGLAVSAEAAASLFGPRWTRDERWRIARCGIDLGAFRAAGEARLAAREALGLPADAVVFGHVGRFSPEKNHRFLLRIAAAVLAREPRAYFVLVGDGPLLEEIRGEAARGGLASRVRFTGRREDVPRLLASFDVLLLPSVREGLPLVGVEAQAAGVPVVCSDRVTREVVVVPGLFTWRSPLDPAESWADAALGALRSRSAPSDEAVAAIERSDFSLSRSVDALLGVYGAAA